MQPRALLGCHQADLCNPAVQHAGHGDVLPKAFNALGQAEWGVILLELRPARKPLGGHCRSFKIICQRCAQSFFISAFNMHLVKQLIAFTATAFHQFRQCRHFSL